MSNTLSVAARRQCIHLSLQKLNTMLSSHRLRLLTPERVQVVLGLEQARTGGGELKLSYCP